MSSQPQPQLQEVPDLEPDQLPRRAFFGYDRSTVVDLLNTMSARIRMLIQERAERDRRIAELKRELERNQESQQLIGETLIAAREEAKTIREDSRRSAAKVLHSAEKRAKTDRCRGGTNGRLRGEGQHDRGIPRASRSRRHGSAGAAGPAGRGRTRARLRRGRAPSSFPTS